MNQLFVSFQKLNIGLADLDLSWNCIRQKGGVAIAKALMVSQFKSQHQHCK